MKPQLQGALHKKPTAQKRKVKINFTAKSYLQNLGWWRERWKEGEKRKKEKGGKNVR